MQARHDSRPFNRPPWRPRRDLLDYRRRNIPIPMHLLFDLPMHLLFDFLK
jgi:hypothetical protein